MPEPELAPLTDKEQAELDRLMAAVFLPTFTEREREIATRAARAAFAAQRAALSAAEAERDELRAEYKTVTHKVITCGVAATHPNANLTNTGAYKEKWDSPQAESVRSLRAERDKLAAENAALLAEACQAGCICGFSRDGKEQPINPDCAYHRAAEHRPDDHSIPWNCPTYYDGCNCESAIDDWQAKAKTLEAENAALREAMEKVKQEQNR